MRHIDEIPLQALIVTEGWKVEHNRFYDLEPLEEVEIAGLTNNDGWALFNEDMLLIAYEEKAIAIDLGWHPEEDSNGCFILGLAKNTDWQNPLVLFESRSKDEVVTKINELLMKVTRGEIK
jgi:hypothetical protein